MLKAVATACATPFAFVCKKAIALSHLSTQAQLAGSLPVGQAPAENGQRSNRQGGVSAQAQATEHGNIDRLAQAKYMYAECCDESALAD